MASEALFLDSTTAVGDLANFIKRAKTIEDDAAQFTARATALAVYTPVLVPTALGQGDYTILGMRVHQLAQPANLSACYSLASILDRLTRMGQTSTQFMLPPVEVHPVWAGIQVPVSGWEAVGQVADLDLTAAAKEGINAVAAALPANPGRPVVNQVRQRVWSSPQTDTTPQLPLGAGFAMQTLGFLAEGGTSKIFRSGPWLRVTSPRGHVLLRRSASLL